MNTYYADFDGVQPLSKQTGYGLMLQSVKQQVLNCSLVIDIVGHY
jgi:hypothetical protein